MLFFALFLMFGIIFSEALYGASMWWYFGLLLLFIIAFLLVAIFKKSRKSFYIPLAFIVGFIAMTAVNLQYNSVSVKDYTGSINAKVGSEIVYNGNYYSFDATDISVDGKTIKYEARVYAYVDEIDFSAGDVVSFYGRLRYYSHEKFDNYYPRKISSGQRYSLTAYSASKISDGQLNFPENLQVRIKRILHQNLDDKTASIVQALVLGDKSGMDSGMYDDVKSSGLAHVLAVSGLHVSTLATAIYFMLKKLKVNPKISFAIVLVCTFLYSMLCSFTASSLRAVIMSGVYMFSSAFSRKKDDVSSLSLAAIVILFVRPADIFDVGFLLSLRKKDDVSSLSLAAIVILFVRPADIFDVGFLLSFASVAGIFLFDRSFEKVGLRIVEKVSPKRKIGTKFAKVCALSLSTNLFTYPFVAYFFGEVPTLFVLSNFIVLPYIMAFYVLALVLTFLATITGFGAIVLPLKYLLVPFRLFVGLVGSVSFSTVSVSASVFTVISLVCLMVFVSRFVFLDRVKKARGACFILCVGMLMRSILLAVG